jgi:uncharacterized protein YutE (UPF0331/DUF86 family)
MSTTGKLSSKLDRLRKDCGRLEQHRQLSLEEFLADVSAQDQVCYLLFTTYENARELADGLIGLRGLPKPTDEADIFAFLGEQDVLSDTCVAQLNAMEGLCTSLSEDYEDIDPEWVYQALQINLSGLYQFAEQVQAYLDQ